MAGLITPSIAAPSSGQLEPVGVDLPGDVDVLGVPGPPARDDGDVVEPVGPAPRLEDADLDLCHLVRPPAFVGPVRLHHPPACLRTQLRTPGRHADDPSSYSARGVASGSPRRTDSAPPRPRISSRCSPPRPPPDPSRRHRAAAATWVATPSGLACLLRGARARTIPANPGLFFGGHSGARHTDRPPSSSRWPSGCGVMQRPRARPRPRALGRRRRPAAPRRRGRPAERPAGPVGHPQDRPPSRGRPTQRARAKPTERPLTGRRGHGEAPGRARATVAGETAAGGRSRRLAAVDRGHADTARPAGRRAGGRGRRHRLEDRLRHPGDPAALRPAATPSSAT